MGLFDKIFSKAEDKAAEKAAASAPAKPEAIEAQASANTVCAPVAGKLIPITEVPDPVFSSEMLGKGCAIWPEDKVIYAPCDGTVTVTMGHAVGLTSSDGIEVLVHVGVDTVNMNGEGFEGYVAKGDTVKAGQPMITIDRDKIKAAGYPDCVVVAISNSAELAGVELAAEAESNVAAGSPVLTITR